MTLKLVKGRDHISTGEYRVDHWTPDPHIIQNIGLMSNNTPRFSYVVELFS